MWNWFNCYLSGRHEFGVWCEPGAIFLRCVHCGRRSAGWSITTPGRPAPAPAKRGAAAKGRGGSARVVRFTRGVAG